MQHVIDSPLGPIRLVVEAGALRQVELHAGTAPAEVPVDPVLAAAARQLAEYFAGVRTDFDLPLGAAGTPFQRTVWDALRAVPYGATRTYADIARAVGRPSATRAVGAANGRNPLAIVVPCHRIVGSDGTLTGYGGGLPAKRWLLAHEARIAGTALALG